MGYLLLIIYLAVAIPCENTLFDFKSVKTSGEWFVVNDDVMGGISTSEFLINSNNTATFSGTLSPDNNGGFASIRARIDDRINAASNGVKIRVQGDGNDYSIRFRTNANFDGYAYQAKFQTKENKWIEYKLPFSSFDPTFRGRQLSNKPALESMYIEQIGFLIADYQFGKFSLDIDWIKLF